MSIIEDTIQIAEISIFCSSRRWVLVAITLAEVFRKFYGVTGYSSVKHYVRQIENIIEWFVICSVFIISHVYTNRTYTW